MDCRTNEGVIVLFGQAVTVLMVFQVVHLFIKRIGQPRVISEILTGILVGTVLSRIGPLDGEFDDDSREMLSGVADIGRTLYMFMIGLELDPAFLWQSRKRAPLVMVSTLCASTAISLGFTPSVMSTLDTKVGYSRFIFLFTVIIAGTSAPTVVRTAAELKLATTDIGRLAITTSILSDMVVLLLGGVNPGQSSNVVLAIVLDSFQIASSLIVTMYICRPMLRWMDRRNHGREISSFQFGVLIVGLLCLTMGQGEGSSQQIFLAFFFGLAFPKTGKLGRSVVRRMRAPVHDLLLPLLFAYGSMQADVRNMGGRDVGLVIATVVLSLVGKSLGTTCVCRLLGIPWAQTIVMGLLLNVKGQVDLIILSRSIGNDKAEQEVLLVAIISATINTLMTPPLVMAIVKFDRHSVAGYKPVGLELLPPESELRMLTAAHMTASLPSLLSLVEGTRGPFASPTSVYFMQLIELTDANACMLLQADSDKSNVLRVRPVSLDPADSSVSAAIAAATDNEEEDESSGTTLATETRQIGLALSSFGQATGISIRHVKAFSGFSNMHEDICNGADDLRASVIIMPFHKQQRLDGGMETVNEGHRSVNEKVLHHARCTVGILIDRGPGLTVTAQATAAPGLLYQVAVLFFGGPDDREALAYASRMVEHPGVSLTVVRFLPRSEDDYANALEMQAESENKVLTKIREHEKDRAVDETYVANFYTRHVAAGSVSYVVKYVANCVETADAVGELQGTYHLLVVGKGSREGTPLTAGMADWAEYPELGHIGDLLASTDFGFRGLVLVVQQCRDDETAEDENDFA